LKPYDIKSVLNYYLMSAQILATKPYTPPRRVNIIIRSSLTRAPNHNSSRPFLFNDNSLVERARGIVQITPQLVLDNVC